MKRYLAVAMAITLIAGAATVAAQAPGWKQRIDRSTSASDPDPAGEVTFMAMGGGFHAVNPSAATYWNPKNTTTGNYALKATFAQNARSSHPNYLGLLFGGKDLDGPNQSYTYFLVAPQNGTWILKQRTGEQTKDVLPRGKNAAVVQLEDLDVVVGAERARAQLDQPQHHVHAHAHVGRHHDGNGGRGAVDGIAFRHAQGS